MTHAIYALFAALAFVSACQTPVAPGETPGGRDQRLNRIAAVLEENYVHPNVAARAANLLRRRGASYAPLGDQDLAVRLNAELQTVTRDRHLILSYSDKARSPPRDEAEITPEQRQRMDEFARSVTMASRPSSDCPTTSAICALMASCRTDVGGPTLSAAMNGFADTRALIIDLRYSDHGGDRPWSHSSAAI